MRLRNNSSEICLTEWRKNGEWEIKETEMYNKVITYPLTQYYRVYATLTIKRKYWYYLVNIVMPCVIMSMLSFLMFFLPPEAGEKISLGVTVLLSYSVFLLLLADSMPQTSDYIPILGKCKNLHYRSVKLFK